MTLALHAGLHTAVWIIVYSLALTAVLLASLLARGEEDRPIRSLVFREAYAVLAISLIYLAVSLGLAEALSGSGLRLVHAFMNGVFLHALALIAAALAPFAARLRESRTGERPRAGGREARTARMADAGAGILAAAFACVDFVSTGKGALPLPARLSMMLPLDIVALFLSAAVLRSAALLFFPAEEGKGKALLAPRLMAAAAAGCYALFIAVELLPQLLCADRGAEVQRYFFLAAFFLALNGGIIALLAPRAGTLLRQGARADRPAQPGSREAALRAGLSLREAEVAGLLAEGLSYKAIADRLCVSLSTVQSHVNHIYAKTGSRNKVELANALRASAKEEP